MGEAKQKAELYIKQSIGYLENAFEEIKKGEHEKASEFLWGSVAEAIKAFTMARKGLEVKAHAEFWDLAREMARELDDEAIYTVFREANSLHSNFYEAKLKREDVLISSERIRMLVGKLLDLTRYELSL